MLVADKETFNYCIKTERKFKEPYIKVKHIFPRTRSSAGFRSLPSISARASLTPQDSFEHSFSGIPSFHLHRRSIQSDDDEYNLKSIQSDTNTEFGLPPLPSILEADSPALPRDILSKFTSPAHRLSQPNGISAKISNSLSTTPDIQNKTDDDESIVDFVLNTINNFFRNTGSEKPLNRS